MFSQQCLAKKIVSYAQNSLFKVVSYKLKMTNIRHDCSISIVRINLS
jgi:hypothetical protein